MNSFVEISAVKIIRTAIDRAMQWQYPARVISRPGMGKTTALRFFERERNAVYCLVKAQYKDTAGLYLMLLEAYKIPVWKKTAREHAKQVYDRLKTENYVHDTWQMGRHTRPLLVDEYQTFEATALRELLNIVEECQIPLVLCGNGERLANERRTERPALDQISNRVRPTYRIDSPDSEDCRSLAVEFNVEYAKPVYAAIAAYGERTSVRDLVCLLDEARGMAVTGPIKLEHIELAAMSIHGGRDATKLLSPQA